jgi:hypothetical protein
MEQGAAGGSDFALRRCVIVWGFREQARAYRREMSGGRMHSARSAPFQPGKPERFICPSRLRGPW